MAAKLSRPHVMDLAGREPGESELLMRYFLRGLRVFLITVKGLWIVLWSAYQLALGAALVLLVWAALKVSSHFHLWDIRSLRHVNPPTTAFIERELEDFRRDAAADSLKWEWISYDSIPKTLREIVLVAEDGKFFAHQGFDLEQIEYAIVANHQQGRPARGASTITQQVAKNLYLSSDKDLSRKLREAVITLLLEHYLAKERILEIYLNVAQFDRGVFGVAAAAEHHFAKPLGRLGQDEMLALACLLPNPGKWDPHENGRAYARHRWRVQRNYALYKGLKPPEEKPGALALDALDSLSARLAEERWSGLRTSRTVDREDESNGAGNDSAAAPAKAPDAQPGPARSGGPGREGRRPDTAASGSSPESPGNGRITF